MLQRDGVMMVQMEVLVMDMMMMMILMKSGAMVMTMATISPLQEGISPVDFCLPKSFSPSSVLRPAEAAVSISEPPPLDLGFRGRSNMRRGDGSSGPGGSHHRAARLGAGPRPLVVRLPCGPSRLLLPVSSVFW
jgi:hypothetical protein